MKKIKTPMPTPVQKAIAKVSEGTKTAVHQLVTQYGYRFASLPDEARQAIRNAVIADLKANTYVSMTACALAYGVTPPNVKKWRDEDQHGIKTIRARGRKEGSKNKYSHVIDDEGNEVLVPFVPRASVKSVRKVVKKDLLVKVPAKRGRPKKEAPKKQGRPKKGRVVSLKLVEVKPNKTGKKIIAVKKRGRGRPKGSKNKA